MAVIIRIPLFKRIFIILGFFGTFYIFDAGKTLAYAGFNINGAALQGLNYSCFCTVVLKLGVLMYGRG